MLADGEITPVRLRGKLVPYFKKPHRSQPPNFRLFGSIGERTANEYLFNYVSSSLFIACFALPGRDQVASGDAEEAEGLVSKARHGLLDALGHHITSVVTMRKGSNAARLRNPHRATPTTQKQKA